MTVIRIWTLQGTPTNDNVGPHDLTVKSWTVEYGHEDIHTNKQIMLTTRQVLEAITDKDTDEDLEHPTATDVDADVVAGDVEFGSYSLEWMTRIWHLPHTTGPENKDVAITCK